MPLLHQAMVGPLARHRQTVELTRQPNGEITDIDHLLDLAKAFGESLPGLDRDQAPKLRFRGPKLRTEQAHQLTAARRRNHAPAKERRMCLTDPMRDVALIRLAQMRDDLSCNRSAHLHRAAAKHRWIDAEFRQQRRHVFSKARRSNRYIIHGTFRSDPGLNAARRDALVHATTARAVLARMAAAKCFPSRGDPQRALAVNRQRPNATTGPGQCWLYQPA